MIKSKVICWKEFITKQWSSVPTPQVSTITSLSEHISAWLCNGFVGCRVMSVAQEEVIKAQEIFKRSEWTLVWMFESTESFLDNSSLRRRVLTESRWWVPVESSMSFWLMYRLKPHGKKEVPLKRDTWVDQAEQQRKVWWPLSLRRKQNRALREARQRPHEESSL